MSDQHRPVYETAEHLEAEEEIAQQLVQHWECRLEKLPISYGLDWVALRDGLPVGFVEAKRRHHTFGRYADIFLSVKKAVSAQQLHNATGLPCAFVVGFDDVVAWTDMLTHRSCVIGGRNDRSDWQDIEPLLMVPLSDFKKLGRDG